MLDDADLAAVMTQWVNDILGEYDDEEELETDRFVEVVVHGPECRHTPSHRGWVGQAGALPARRFRRWLQRLINP